MSPSRSDGQRCPYCSSTNLLKFGYDWRCESCFNGSRGFDIASAKWLAEFHEKEASAPIFQKLRDRRLTRFARVAKVWPGYTEEELADIYSSIFRLRDEIGRVCSALPVNEIIAEHEEWNRKVHEMLEMQHREKDNPEALNRWLIRLDQMTKEGRRAEFMEENTPSEDSKPPSRLDEHPSSAARGAPQKATPINPFDGLKGKNVDISRYMDDANLTDSQYNAYSLVKEYDLPLRDAATRLGLHHSTVNEYVLAAEKKIGIAQAKKNTPPSMKR
jgi:hypothetical protein